MNQVGSSTLEVGTVIIALDTHMAIIQIQIGKKYNKKCVARQRFWNIYHHNS
jgi:hypothetical protein